MRIKKRSISLYLSDEVVEFLKPYRKKYEASMKVDALIKASEDFNQFQKGKNEEKK